MNKFPFILCLFVSLYVHSKCKIQSYESILKFNRVLDRSIIKSSTCSEEIQNIFIKSISELTGLIPHKYLESTFLSIYKKNVSISPSKIYISAASDFLSKEFTQNKLVFKNIKSLYQYASFSSTLSEFKNLKVKCTKCSRPGEKSIKFVTKANSFWVSADAFELKTGHRLSKGINPFAQKFSKSDLKKVTFLDKDHSPLFQNIEQLEFYRPRRTLNKGDILRQSDLIPRKLISFNDKVDIILYGPDIRLEMTAIAKESGQYGQTIKFFNPKSKKTINAKVINFKKAVINL